MIKTRDSVFFVIKSTGFFVLSYLLFIINICTRSPVILNDKFLIQHKTLDGYLSLLSFFNISIYFTLPFYLLIMATLICYINRKYTYLSRKTLLRIFIIVIIFSVIYFFYYSFIPSFIDNINQKSILLFSYSIFEQTDFNYIEVGYYIFGFTITWICYKFKTQFKN